MGQEREDVGGAPRRHRPRGRPRADAGGNLLTRTLIAEKALAIAGQEGFPAVSMHRLAGELGVTPRALYNHVEGRQDVVDAAAALMMQKVPRTSLDSQDWRGSFRRLYREARTMYRSLPRATLISLEETITASAVDPRRIETTEDMLRFFTEIGLSLTRAITVRDSFLIDVFGFVLLVDYSYDRAEQRVRNALSQPVPHVWLEAVPDAEAPLSREAARDPGPTSDDRFEDLVDLRMAAVESLLEHRSAQVLEADDGIDLH